MILSLKLRFIVQYQVEITEEQINWLFRMRCRDLAQKFLAQLGAIFINERFLLGILRIQIPERLSHVVLKFHYVMPQIHQGLIPVVAPQVGLECGVGGGVRGVEDSHDYSLIT